MTMDSSGPTSGRVSGDPVSDSPVSDSPVSDSPVSDSPVFWATTWTDYLCPWAYLGRRQTQWIREQGVPVAIRAYELHPEIPHEGRTIRPGGSYDRLLDQLRTQSLDAGVDFEKPARTPNTRSSLELLELIHRDQPDRSLPFDEAIAAAHWIHGRPIDDSSVLEAIADEAGVDEQVMQRWRLGEGSALLDAGRSQAIELDVSATPSWRVGELTISGIHHDEQFQRWIGRLIERQSR